MTATTYTHLPTPKRTSFLAGLGRVFWRLVEARQKQVNERIARHFEGMDDDFLVKLGYSRADIRRIRQG